VGAILGLDAVVLIANDLLPFADPAYHHSPHLHPSPAVRQLAATARVSHTLVLGSPTYHNSYSVLLKNPLDLLSIAEIAGKAVALVSHSGHGPSTHALDHLRLAVRGLHAVPIQVATSDADNGTSGERLRVSGSAARDRLRRLAGELWYAARLGQVDSPSPQPANVVETQCASG
jgi:NAD(P)H-dependent FMN reductase